jgi:hypothetical protein
VVPKIEVNLRRDTLLRKKLRVEKPSCRNRMKRRRRKKLIYEPRKKLSNKDCRTFRIK